MRLLVLAGGFGHRLRSAVSDVPKVLALVGDTPFLHLQIERWLAQGVREFTFLLHHRANQIVDFLEMQEGLLPKDCRFNWVFEPQPMDTGGAVAYAVKTLDIDDNFLLCNGDTWLGGGIREVIQATAPAIVVVHRDNVCRYGQIQFNEDQHVTAFGEKDDQQTPGWINSGLCHLDPKIFKNWDGKPFSLERDLFPNLLQLQRLTAVPLGVEFVDIGIPEDYYKFCRWIESGKQESI